MNYIILNDVYVKDEIIYINHIGPLLKNNLKINICRGREDCEFYSGCLGYFTCVAKIVILYVMLFYIKITINEI
jgi:hypothetical protein